MKLILLSVKLFVYGLYCDVLATACTKIAERRITSGKSVSVKLLINMSNLSDRKLKKWQSIEQRFIQISLKR